MRLLPVVAVLTGLIATALTDAAPVPKEWADREEKFEWKGAKRTRTVRTVVLGGERMEFVTVPKGTFLMGSPESDGSAADNEKPQHEVTFTKPLWVGKCPVTRGQFAAFVKATKYRTEAEKDGKGFAQSVKYTWKETGSEPTDAHPVVNVTWNDAAAYCAWASKEGKTTMRLLTEAEYEFANRGGEATVYITGDKAESLDGFANIADKSARAKFGDWVVADFEDGEVFASPVGKYRENGFGLHDTTGNVYCWCADGYAADASAGRKDGVTDPKPHGDGEPKHRVLRGGAWNFNSPFARAAYHRWLGPGHRGHGVGFRVALASN